MVHLEELNDVLRASGLEPLAFGTDVRTRRTLTPTTIEYPGDRGGVDVQRFGNEDALCRHLLREALEHAGPRPGAVLHEASPSLAGSAAPRGGPRRLWSRPLPGAIVARGHGLLLLRDATPLLDDPRSGAPQLHLVDVATGAVGATRFAPAGRGRCVVTAGGAVVVGPDVVEADAGWSAPSGGAERAEEVPGGVLLQGRDGRTRCLDLDDGRVRWSGDLADLVFTAHDRAVRSRFVRIEPDPQRLVVDLVDLTSGSATERMVDVALPESWRGAGFVAVVDRLTGDGTGGHVVLRARVPRPGRVLAYGDVVVRHGSVTWLHEVPEEGGRGTVSAIDSFSPERVFLSASWAARDPSYLQDLDGRRLWTRNARVRPAAAAEGLTLLDGGLARASAAEAVDDDGGTRWRRAGRVLGVSGDRVWLEEQVGISVVELGSGHLRGTVAAPRTEGPVRDGEGAHPGDDVVLVLRDDELVAYGCD